MTLGTGLAIAGIWLALAVMAWVAPLVSFWLAGPLLAAFLTVVICERKT